MGSVAPVPVVAWGNALRPVVETTSTLTFGKRTNPAFRAICAELDRRNAPEGPSFVIRPARTRAERTKGSRGPLALYRREGLTEPLPFGVYGGVTTPGRVSVGDTVSVRS